MQIQRYKQRVSFYKKISMTNWTRWCMYYLYLRLFASIYRRNKRTIIQSENRCWNVYIMWCLSALSQANSAFHHSSVDKWGPASAGKEKAAMVHSVSGWTCDVQVNMWDHLRTRALPESFRGAFTRIRYARLPRLLLHSNKITSCLCVKCCKFSTKASKLSLNTQCSDQPAPHALL